LKGAKREIPRGIEIDLYN